MINFHRRERGEARKGAEEKKEEDENLKTRTNRCAEQIAFIDIARGGVCDAQVRNFCQNEK